MLDRGYRCAFARHTIRGVPRVRFTHYKRVGHLARLAPLVLGYFEGLWRLCCRSGRLFWLSNAPQLRNLLLGAFPAIGRCRVFRRGLDVKVLDKAIYDKLCKEVVFVAHDHRVGFHANLGIAAKAVCDHPPQGVVDLVQGYALALHGHEICDHEHH